MLNFPNAPADGEISAQPNGVQYQWNDTLSRWDSLSSKLPAVAGTIVQVQNVQRTDSVTTASIIDLNTIPQITDGVQVLSLPFTPKFATSIIQFDINLTVNNSTASRQAVIALFKDPISDAIAGTAGPWLNFSGVYASATMLHQAPAGDTDLRTYTVRMGPASASTLRLNGNTDTLLGGVNFSGMTITEIQPNAVQPEPVPPGIMLRALIDGDNGNVIDGGAGLSINNTGTGIFEVTFDTPMPDIDYAISLTIGDIAGSRGFSLANAKTVNGFTVLIANTTNTLVSRDFEMLVVHQFAWPPLPVDIPSVAFMEVASDGSTVSRDNGLLTAVSGGTGIVNVSFVTPLPDTNYNVQVTAIGTTGRYGHVANPLTTGFDIRIRNGASDSLQSAICQILVTRTASPF